MSTEAFASAIIALPVETVWAALRDFTFPGRLMTSSVDSCVMTSGKSPFIVGNVRVIKWKTGEEQHQRLLELSDQYRRITWEVIDANHPMEVSGVVSTITVRRVTADNSTYISWASEFSADVKGDLVMFSTAAFLENIAEVRTMLGEQEAFKAVLKRHTTKKVDVVQLECGKAWSGLTEKEKLYAHHMSQASWYGALATVVQISPEAPLIFDFLQTLFSGGVDELKNKATAGNGVSAEAFASLLDYATCFYGNMGNYLSFGDSKFVPGISVEDLNKVVSAYDGSQKAGLVALFDRIKTDMYSLEEGVRELGLKGQGISTYFGDTVTNEDIALVGDYFNEKNISPYNTRLWRDGSVLQVLVASADLKLTTSETFRGQQIDTVYGDHHLAMAIAADHLRKARAYAANENQEKMLDKYVEAFTSGSMDAHKDSQRWWIRDQGPVVETNIGFIESYRDPTGIRGEWEGFVAVVNKSMSQKFDRLVEGAPSLLTKLPWPPAFEKDSFKRPDFTSLDVVTFAGSGIPAGINIPNYDEIRQTEGFKNVSLGNVISARSPTDRVDYIPEADQALYKALLLDSFEVQVGIHELLGHGSGKLFAEEKDGLNFDKDTVHPITKGPIKTYYKPGQTWSSVFASLASAYEECRAECCGIFLSVDETVLDIFGHTGAEADDVMYINWLSMVRNGVTSTLFYSPESASWKQAHCQARYVILQVLLEAGQGFVSIKFDGNELEVSIDRSKIRTVGVPAIGDFLMKLQVYKATADLEEGSAMFNKYSVVTAEFLKIRKHVESKKKERPVFVQSHTKLSGGKVERVEFEASSKGLIESFHARFPRTPFNSIPVTASSSSSSLSSSTATLSSSSTWSPAPLSVGGAYLDSSFDVMNTSGFAGFHPHFAAYGPGYVGSLNF